MYIAKRYSAQYTALCVYAYACTCACMCVCTNVWVYIYVYMDTRNSMPVYVCDLQWGQRRRKYERKSQQPQHTIRYSMCIYACTFMHTCICVRAYMCTCIYVYMHVCVCTRKQQQHKIPTMSVCALVNHNSTKYTTHIHTHVCVCICLYVCIHVYICVCIHVYAYMYMCTCEHTCIHVYVYMCTCVYMSTCTHYSTRVYVSDLQWQQRRRKRQRVSEQPQHTKFSHGPGQNFSKISSLLNWKYFNALAVLSHSPGCWCEYAYMHIYVYIYIYVYTHTYIYTYTYIYMCVYI